MPRGVAKAKDGGVDKKGKGDVKVVVGKRSRKMRGGDGGAFGKYCTLFIERNLPNFNNYKIYIKENFKKIKEIIYANEKNKTKILGYQTKRFKSDTRKEQETIITDINLMIDDSEKNKYLFDKITPEKLISVLKYINEDFILVDRKTIYEKNGINNDILQTLYKNLFFLKIYKLFEEFANISEKTEIRFDIQIATEKGDDMQYNEALTRQSSIKHNGSERTLSRHKEQPSPNGIQNGDEESGIYLQETDTNSVYGNWLDTQTIKDRDENQGRRPSAIALSDRTNKHLTSTQTNRASAVQQQRDLGVIQENPTSDSEDKEEIGKILEYSIVDVQKKIVLNKDETIHALEKVYKELINTAEFKRIEENKNILKTNIVQKGAVIGIIDDLITTTYNKVIEIIKQQNTRGFSIDLLIKSIQEQAIKEFNDVEKNIVSLSIKDQNMNKDDRQLIKDAGELAKIINPIYISILEKHIGFLDNLKPKKIRGDITPEGTEEEEETEILDTQDGNQETDVQQVEHIGIRAFPATSQEALSLSSSNSLNSLPAITDSVKKSYGKLLKDQYNRIKNDLKKKIDKHIILYKAANDQLITGDETELKIKFKKFIIIAEELFIKSIRKAFEILYENNNSEEILVSYENSAPNKAEFISNVNNTYKNYLIKYRLIGVRAEEIITKIFADIIDFGVGFHLFCYKMLKNAFKDEKIVWSVSGGKLRKQRINQQKEPTKTHKANEPPTKKPKANEPINKPTKIPKQKKPTKDPKPTAKKPTKK